MYQKETPVGKREQQRATTFIPVVCKYVVDLFAVPLPFYLVVYTCISEGTLSSERATRKGKMEDEEREREREMHTSGLEGHLHDGGVCIRGRQMEH